jgi:5-methylcytosine-specific restriction endonuclease McrA
MTDAIWKEFRLFCPVCNDHFTQLVVIHKVPANFNIEPYLEGMIESHDHQVFQQAKANAEAQAERAAGADPEKPETL